MKARKPQPRPVPQRVGFGTPHDPYFRACRQFWRDLERAEQDAYTEIARMRENLGVSVEYTENRAVQIYAATIHLFAAMAAEAAISTYGVVRYGEVAYNKHFRAIRTVSRRLRAILAYLEPTVIDKRPELYTLLQRLLLHRNELVHPTGTEDTYDESGQPHTARRKIEITKDSAGRAMSDLNDFLLALQSLDHEIGPFLIVF